MTPGSWAFLVDSVPFTRDVIAGHTSLGGSESSMIGTARALKAAGHDVHAFATKLDDDARGRDPWGVVWHPLADFPAMNQFVEWDVVVGLRMYPFFHSQIQARLRVLWNQDLLPPKQADNVMSVAWALDKSVYVSEYHRQQWEDLLPEITGVGAVTRNGFDPAHVPTDVVKDPNQIIHISRPERGLAPIINMWPELRKRNPQAVLKLCRYSSMYDAQGWGKVCDTFDEMVAELNEQVGGIEFLGELNKADLYRAIAESAVMWYPGIPTFAETSCIAAIEAQANGTPLVGSLKGALPETARPSFDAGLLIPGDALVDPTYHEASIQAVLDVMNGCRNNAKWYRDLQQAGRAHVEAYTYAAVAADWERQVEGWFLDRYETNRLGIMRALAHEEDRTASLRVAQDILAEHDDDGENSFVDVSPGGIYSEAEAERDLADRIIHGKTCTAQQYSDFAIHDPLYEVEQAGRFRDVARYFAPCSRVLDIACGNGAGAIAFALAHPHLHVVGMDYAPDNIARAIEAAEKVGVSDRCTFLTGTVWNFDTGTPHQDFERVREYGPFDGMFVGEFVEHIADCTTLVDWLETFLTVGAAVVYTCPVGPFIELAPRGMPLQYTHVHHFRHDDVRAVWGTKLGCAADFCSTGRTVRNQSVGHWVIHYTVAPDRPAGRRDYATRIIRTRPMPTLSVGIIAKDAEQDLARCLTSVWGIADEIVVGDTGSEDGTKAIAQQFGAKVIDLPPVDQIREGFAGARNAVLNACSGDWFLWIDTDEQLMDSHRVRRYLDGAVFNGFVLYQHHLMLDAAPHYDKPCRIFRRTPAIQFYGCVHEQPQQGDCNGEIHPSLEISSAHPLDNLPRIAHTGYLTEQVRRAKMRHRNLPLLVRDQEVFADRELGKVLVMRDYVTLSDEDCNEAQGMTDKAQAGYAAAIRIFMDRFDDPRHKYHALARPFYETALQRLGKGVEVEIAIAGKGGQGLGPTRAKPARMWVRDMAEFERFMAWKVQDAIKPLREVPMKTDPFPVQEGIAA